MIYFKASFWYKEKEVKNISDRDREVKLSWAQTVTLIHRDVYFMDTESVGTYETLVTSLLKTKPNNAKSILNSDAIKLL